MLIRIDKSKDNPLIAAYLERDFDEFKKLIHDGRNVNCLTNENRPLIYLIVGNEAKASNSMNMKFFMEILSANPYLGNLKAEYCLLKLCVENNNECFLDCLLKNGAEVCSNNYYWDGHWDGQNNQFNYFHGNLLFLLD